MRLLFCTLLTVFSMLAAAEESSNPLIYGPPTGPALGNNVLFAPHGNGLAAIDDQTGKILWESQIPDERTIYTISCTSDKIISLTKQNLAELCPNIGDETFRQLKADSFIANAPVFIGAPNRLAYPEQWQYQSFASRYKNRSATVYAQNGHGLIQAFNTQTGKQAWAFLPNNLLQQPHNQPSVATQENLAAGDIQADGRWHSILVAGMNQNGRSVFAFDITVTNKDDDQELKPKLLWSFSHQNLGHSFGKPAIVRLNNGRWAVIFGNGYEFEYGGRWPSLFIVDAFTGELIKEIKAGFGPQTNPAGLSNVTPADYNGDFITDAVYAGDLHGRLWKFDLSSRNSSLWSTAYSGQPLFQATDKSLNPLAITTAPIVAKHSGGEDYGIMIYVGTGHCLPNLPAQNNAVYGLQEPINATAAHFPITQGQLTKQTLSEQTSGQQPIRLLTDRPVIYNTAGQAQRGWMIPLLGHEAIVSPLVLQLNTLIFSTTSKQDGQCRADLPAWIMQANTYNGGPIKRGQYQPIVLTSLNGKSAEDLTQQEPHIAGSATPHATAASSAYPFNPEALYLNSLNGPFALPMPQLKAHRQTWRVIE